MEVIKRKILLENSIDRTNPKTWGALTASTFYINVMLTQNVDDMGLFIDSEFIKKDSANTPVDYTVLKTKLTQLGYSFPFMLGAQEQSIIPLLNKKDRKILRLPSKTEINYHNYGNLILTGSTDSKIEDVRSYAKDNPFRILFDTKTDSYVNYKGDLINGVDRIKQKGEPTIYVFDTPNDLDLGTPTQRHGIQYMDYTGLTRSVTTNDGLESIPVTNFRFRTQGWNETNTSLSALTKEEYLFGIISPPEVESDVFIDRGETTVTDLHLRLSEIKNLDQLSRYGNRLYKINKQ
jgi:hypothetical protein